MKLRSIWFTFSVGGILLAACLMIGAGSEAADKKEVKVPPLDEVMEDVTDTNKILLRGRRYNTIQFKAKAKELAAAAEKMAKLMEMAKAHSGTQKDPANKKEWEAISAKNKQNAMDLAKVAAKADRTQYRKVYNLMSQTCTSCHDKFRD